MAKATPAGFYPPLSFSFSLSFKGIDDKKDIGFLEASGLDMEMSTTEIGSGGENLFKYKLPGVMKFNNLVLKRGMVPANSKLAAWVQSTLSNGLAEPIKTKDISLKLLDRKGKILVSWDFVNAYPVKWNISEFKSMENTYVTETMEFAYNYFKKN